MAVANRDIRQDSAGGRKIPVALRAQADQSPKGATKLRRQRPHIEFSTPQSFVHCLLFIIEYSSSEDARRLAHARRLSFFFSRAGGLHLLLMLLNAYYNKPEAGRRPGWAFRGIRSRIQVSERALRMLINDAVAEGLIDSQAGEKDRRCRTYRLTPPVIEAWEALTETLRSSLTDVFDQFDAGALANIDYRSWDPAKPARDQIDRVPPSRRHINRA